MNANSLPQDAIDALSAIGKMSRENEATNRGVEPWYRALMKTVTSDRIYLDPRCDNPEEAARRLFARHTGAAAHEAMSHRNARSWSLPIDDGDRPADMTDEEYARLTYPGRSQRLETHDAIWDALLARCDVRCDVVLYPERVIGGFGAVVRKTHRALHRALVGGPVVDALGRECKWCEESSR